MKCDEAEILLQALIDGELDAGHAREVEAHVATCAKCGALLTDYREMSKAVANAGALGFITALTQPTPADLARELARNKKLAAAWEKLSFTNQKEMALGLTEAKKPETRERRLAAALEKLRS